jgi:hypothetical protein
MEHVQSREVGGGLSVAYRLAGPFVCRCLASQTVLRFHLPLIEPDAAAPFVRHPPANDARTTFKNRQMCNAFHIWRFPKNLSLYRVT